MRLALIGDRVRWGDTLSITMFVMKFEMFMRSSVAAAVGALGF